MSNKLHENNGTSPENNQDDLNTNNNNLIGVSESTMKMIVIVLGVLLFFGFVGVVGTIVYRVVNLPQEDVPLAQNNNSSVFEMAQTSNNVTFGNIEIEKPRNTTLKNFHVSDGMIYLYFENSLGFENIKIVRLSDGMVMGNVDFVQGQ